MLKARTRHKQRSMPAAAGSVILELFTFRRGRPANRASLDLVPTPTSASLFRLNPAGVLLAAGAGKASGLE